VTPSIKTPYSFGGEHKLFQQHIASESGKVADPNRRRRTGVSNENHELPTGMVNGYVFESHFVTFRLPIVRLFLSVSDPTVKKPRTVSIVQNYLYPPTIRYTIYTSIHRFQTELRKWFRDNPRKSSLATSILQNAK